MKTKEFLDTYNACYDLRSYALSISDNMADVWDRLVSDQKITWLLWATEYAMPKKCLRLMACRFVRETPIANGGTVWDLLTDERSRNAVDISERFAKGDASKDELEDAFESAVNVRQPSKYGYVDYAACAAANSARETNELFFTAHSAISAAGDCKAARAAQVEIIKSFGNPFRK
jgi:hypothetical protein